MKPARPPDLDPIDALVQLSFLVQSLLGRLAAPRELSLVQVRLLGVLRDRTPGMLELATLLGLDKSSVTGLVDRAERRGLVKRSLGQEDRRAVFVSLTPAGRSLAAAFTKEVAREIETLLASLPITARERLTAIANQIIAAAA